jgi:hypothetical protein
VGTDTRASRLPGASEADEVTPTRVNRYHSVGSLSYADRDAGADRRRASHRRQRGGSTSWTPSSHEAALGHGEVDRSEGLLAWQSYNPKLWIESGI